MPKGFSKDYFMLDFVVNNCSVSCKQIQYFIT